MVVDGAAAAPAYRIDERPATAAAFYAAACDPQRSVVVEACAGAGKTWMLVSRILRALLEGVQPQQILAITFTRRAAGEVRARLDEWLAAYSQDLCSADARVQALRERGLDEAQARARQAELGRLHERLLRGGRGVEVRTFHGWFAQLLAQAPATLLETLGLPAACEPIEDPQPLGAELWRDFHRLVDADAALRADYLGLVRRVRRGTLQQWLEAAWRRAPELARADAAGAAEGAVPDAASLWPECRGLSDPAALLQQAPLASEIEALAREFEASGRVKAAHAARDLRTALATVDAPLAFAAAWRALATDKDEPRRQLGDTPLQGAVVQGLARVRQMRLQQQAHEDHAAMLRLARVLLACYARLKHRRGLVDMPDLERAAEAMLLDGELAGWVQERLDQRLRQVLIDEFQDTSPLQWQALQGWLSSYAGAGGGASGQRPPAVFIVGDPKQSIYRFRGAEPRVFEAARDFVVNGLEGCLLQCEHTRRNAPPIVEALNAVFDPAARAEGWGPFRPHTTGSSAAGHVLRLPNAARVPRAKGAPAAPVWRDSLTQPREEAELHLRALEADQVATAVCALMAGHGLQPAEIMVLARQRAALARVADALARHGVPHVVAEPLVLDRSPEALDLVAMLDVLVSPGHDLALARALKSPLLGASDDDLLWLAQAAQGGAGWLQALLRAADLPTPALERARELSARWFESAPRQAPHDLLDRIVHEGDFIARLCAAVPAARRVGALHAVQALLAASLELRGGSRASVYAFVRDFRAGRLRAAGHAPSQAVQLLTVHGAKGLEARAVIVVDADPEARPSERASLLVDWPVERPAPRRVAFVRGLGSLPVSLDALWASEQVARQREELNGLYVAMTRAREWLIFARTEPLRRGTEPAWWARVEGVAAPWAPPSAAAAPEEDRVQVEAPTLPTLTRQPRPGSGSAAPELPSGRLGSAVHRVLEWAAGASAAADFDLRAASKSSALAQGLDEAAAVQVQTMAARVLGSPACARFFGGPGLRWAGNEVPVSIDGELLRIDRLVALAGDEGLTWWVLDYKLHAAPQELPAYRLQLLRYARAVQLLQPGDAVRSAFITGRGELVEC